MEDDKGKWNRRYAENGFYLGQAPSQFLVENIGLISGLTSGRNALDLACGEGRNSVFLAKNGYHVTGMDVSEEGLAKGERWVRTEAAQVEFRCVDLEAYEFSETFDLILNFNFLLRGLIPKMIAALNPGGVIVFESILDTPSLEGSHNKAYLLQPGELRSIFSGYPGEMIICEELDSGPMPTARLIYRKGCTD